MSPSDYPIEVTTKSLPKSLLRILHHPNEMSPSADSTNKGKSFKVIIRSHMERT